MPHVGARAMPTLWTHTLCPYAHRASLALAEKGLEPRAFERHVDLSAKPDALFRVNPRGLVPVLECEDGEIITESSTIIVAVDERFGERRSLTRGRRDEILEFARGADASGDGFVRAGLSFVGGWGFRQGMPRREQIETFQRSVLALDRRLRESQGDYLFGADVSLADISIWPFAERFQLAMREFQGYDIAEGAEYFAVWLAAMSARDSVRQLRTDEDALLQSWRRTMRLDYFDYETASRQSP
jgi:glutathione S-transferase